MGRSGCVESSHADPWRVSPVQTINEINQVCNKNMLNRLFMGGSGCLRNTHVGFCINSHKNLQCHISGLVALGTIHQSSEEHQIE